MEYLKIQSNGEIEIEAFTLIGASSKRGDTTKIGYYGSGLKYSIASMLRNGISFKVFNGSDEVIFSTVAKNFRNESYSAIAVNGKETSLTTTMGGKDWDTTFAPIREIYSNALDEDDDATLETTTECKGRSGKTTFYIEMTGDVRHFKDNFFLYFCQRNPNVLFSNENASVYPETEEGDLRLFRKGILCHHDKKEKALFQYNSKHFTINESRVLDNKYLAQIYCANAWKKCSDEKLISDLVYGLKDSNCAFFEHGLSYTSYSEKFSQTWNTVFSSMKCIPVEMVAYASDDDVKTRIALPGNLLKPLYRQFPDLDILGLSQKSNGSDYIEVNKASEILVNKVIDAISLLNNTRYKHRLNDINIKYVKFTDTNVLGLAENENIYLSVKLDTYDVNAIGKIIIEENEHNLSGFGDETRNFQNHLFDLYFDELYATK